MQKIIKPRHRAGHVISVLYNQTKSKMEIYISDTKPNSNPAYSPHPVAYHPIPVKPPLVSGVYMAEIYCTKK